IILEGIVKSEWWFAGFYNEDYHLCKNFNVMCKKYPSLAQIVQEKSIIRQTIQSCSASVTTYDFQIYEGFQPSSEGMANDITSAWQDHHPLTKLVLLGKHGNESLLMHNLTKAWVISRWK
ncbi:unnamed protein product, partial [Meganyctiphanes norvegica]